MYVSFINLHIIRPYYSLPLVTHGTESFTTHKGTIGQSWDLQVPLFKEPCFLVSQAQIENDIFIFPRVVLNFKQA